MRESPAHSAVELCGIHPRLRVTQKAQLLCCFPSCLYGGSYEDAAGKLSGNRAVLPSQPADAKQALLCSEQLGAPPKTCSLQVPAFWAAAVAVGGVCRQTCTSLIPASLGAKCCKDKDSGVQCQTSYRTVAWQGPCCMVCAEACSCALPFPAHCCLWAFALFSPSSSACSCSGQSLFSAHSLTLLGLFLLL